MATYYCSYTCMARHRPTLHGLGTAVLVAVAAIVLLTVGVSAAFKVAADDLDAAIAEASGRHLDNPRSQPGMWLSAALASDLPEDDIAARHARADQLHYRSERIEEMAAVGALGGLLVGVLSSRPATPAGRVRDTSSPAANTASNGTA
jgi:hypothetical protein